MTNEEILTMLPWLLFIAFLYTIAVLQVKGRIHLSKPAVVVLTIASFGFICGIIWFEPGSSFGGPRASGQACDASQNYGTDVYQDGIRVRGSQEFVSATVDALQKLYYTPSYRHYVKALHEIREDRRGYSQCRSDRECGAWTANDGIMRAWASTARWPCSVYMSRAITHEGAHNVGIGHGPDMDAVEQAVLRELKSSTQIAARAR